jgi:hypothetical protein
MEGESVQMLLRSSLSVRGCLVSRTKQSQAPRVQGSTVWLPAHASGPGPCVQISLRSQALEEGSNRPSLPGINLQGVI